MARESHLRAGDAEATLARRTLNEPQAADARLKAQIRARHQQLYGARLASTTLAATKGVEADPGLETPTSSTRAMSAISKPRVRTLPMPSLAVRALNNLSYGVTPNSIAEFNGLGTTDPQRLANWVDWQLDWTSINDSAVETRLTSAG